MGKIMAYSIADKKKVEMQDPKPYKMANGLWAWKGKSPSGHAIFAIVGKEKPKM
jgi:hypothetical protein